MPTRERHKKEVMTALDPLDVPHAISQLHKHVEPELFKFLGRAKGIRRAIDGTGADPVKGLPRLRAVHHGRKIGVTLRAIMEYVAARNVVSEPEQSTRRKAKAQP